MHEEIKSDMSEVIAQKILNRLGKPPNLLKVDCMNTYDNKWRVNVWVKDTDSVVPGYKILHSYFCEITKSNTCRCNPKIERLYRQTGARPTKDLGPKPTGTEQ